MTDIIKETLKSKKITDLKKELTNETIEEENQLIDKIITQNDKQNRLILDWNKFDFIKRNFKINEGEYDSYIESIKTDKDKYLFDSDNDEDNIEINLTHPSIRKRILSLDKNAGKYNQT